MAFDEVTARRRALRPSHAAASRSWWVGRDTRSPSVTALLGSAAHRVFIFSHYAGNRVLTILTNILYQTTLSNMETCYKVMRADVVRSLTFRSEGFEIEPELTAKIFKRRYRICEVPISYFGRSYEKGKKITWFDGVRAVWVLVKYRFTE